MIERFLYWLDHTSEDQRLHFALAIMVGGVLVFFLGCWLMIQRIIYPAVKPPDGFQRLRDNLDSEPPSRPPGRGFWIVIIVVTTAWLISFLRSKIS